MDRCADALREMTVRYRDHMHGERARAHLAGLSRARSQRSASPAEHGLEVDDGRAVERLEVAHAQGGCRRSAAPVTRCRPIGFGGGAASAWGKTPATGRGGVAARMDPEHVAARAVEPGEHEQVVARRHAVERRGATSGTSSIHASGAPSSPCRGAASGSVSGEATVPIGVSSIPRDHLTPQFSFFELSSASSACSSRLPQEAVDEQQLLAPVGQRLGRLRPLLQPRAKLPEVLAQRAEPPRVASSPTRSPISSRSSGSDFTGVNEDGRARVGAQRLEPLLRERVDRARPRAAGLRARLEVSQLREPLGLDVVLALPGPVEHPPAPRHAQQVVRTGAVAADETEDS